MNKQTLLGTLAGGIAFFLLGWVIYGMLLMTYMSENSNSGIWRSESDMIWWALIASNFLWAYLISLVCDWSNTNGFAGGMQKGLLLGLVSALGMDIGLYANTTFYSSLTPVIVDVIAISIMSGIVGGIIGMIRGGKPATEA